MTAATAIGTIPKIVLQWFMDLYPNLTRDDARKWLGRYGTSGGPQLQRMALLSEGQKAKVVFAKMAKENAHLLLLDEPTNALDMEMIDSLAQALKAFKGGVLLVSHDMRLISQVANEIWIVDHGLTKYQGDIGDFKMTLRRQMNLEEEKIKAERKAQTARAKKQAAFFQIRPGGQLRHCVNTFVRSRTDLCGRYGFSILRQRGDPCRRRQLSLARLSIEARHQSGRGH